MASTITVQGLLRIGRLASQAAGFDAARYIRTVTIDDSATAFTQADTSLGGPANVAAKGFDGVPTTSTTATSATVTHVATFGTGEGNFTIRRVAIHDDVNTNVTGTSTTLVGGRDSQSINKTSDFSLIVTVRLEYKFG